LKIGGKVMKDILNKILEKFLCKHDWQLFETNAVYSTLEYNMPDYYIHILICKKCGKIKKIKL